MKRCFFCFLLFSLGHFVILNAQGMDEKKPGYIPSEEESAFLDKVQTSAFQYFIKEANFKNGLVKDRNTTTSPASIAATGFAIPIWALGSEKGWMSRDSAAQITLNLFRFLHASEQSLDDSATGYQGFYYHFLDMKTGKRFWNCELSSIDTGLLLAGIRFANQFYIFNNPIENEIRELADILTKRINWEFFQIKKDNQFKNTISLGWDKKHGFNDLGWWGYTEALFLYVLSAGAEMPNVEKGYDAWLSFYQWREPYGKESGHVAFPALFIHQFSLLWIDFRNIYDSYMKEKGIDYFENSRRATYVQRKYAIDNPNNWRGYDSLTWGLSACDGPDDSYNFDGKKFFGYSARGTSGPDSTFDDGTIAPYAAGSSIPFAPEICIPTLNSLYKNYGEKGLWGKYGFVDSFNPTLNWFDKDNLGIDQGPMLLMIENYRSGFVWKYLMKDELVRKGLTRLGFTHK